MDRTIRRPSNRRFSWVLAALFCTGGCVYVRVQPSRERGGLAPRPDLAREYEHLADAHNRERARSGLPPLAVSESLTEAARRHADDMASRRRMTHRGGDGSSPFVRMERAGYRYSRAGENVAYGQFTLSELMSDWMRSPGHRRNILGRFTEIGTGYATDAAGTPYWCVTFGTPTGAGLAARVADVGYVSQ